MSPMKQAKKTHDRKLGRMVAALRVERGWAQADLAANVAKQCGVDVSRSMISRVERGFGCDHALFVLLEKVLSPTKPVKL